MPSLELSKPIFQTGLQLLTNLLRVPEGVNVESLFSGLPSCVWVRLIQLLCLADLGLVCAVLETLYTATGMGALACTRLWRALAFADDTTSQRSPNSVFAARRASIHLRPLLALLSLEGQSMGTASLRRVKARLTCYFLFTATKGLVLNCLLATRLSLCFKVLAVFGTWNPCVLAPSPPRAIPRIHRNAWNAE